LSFEISDFKDQKFKKVFLISNKNENRTIELSEKLVKFKSQLIEDQKKRLEEKSINTEIIDLSEIQNINETSYGLYPTVGENLDFINTNNLKIEFLYRKLDQFSWQYCNKGFFNFKNYIPKIITTFN
jgi:predicted YcjX-like family ATPase